MSAEESEKIWVSNEDMRAMARATQRFRVRKADSDEPILIIPKDGDLENYDQPLYGFSEPAMREFVESVEASRWNEDGTMDEELDAVYRNLKELLDDPPV